MQRSRIALLGLWLPLTAAPGCDPPPTPEAKAESKTKAEDDAKTKAGVEEIRKKREAAAKAKADEEAAFAAALDEVCVLPDKLPKKLNKACQAVAEAHDGFMKRHYADDPETLEKWNTASGTQIPFTMTTCNKGRSIEVAACQKHALDNAPAVLKEDAPELLKTCIDKFGRGPAPTGMPLPKKR